MTSKRPNAASPDLATLVLVTVGDQLARAVWAAYGDQVTRAVGPAARDFGQSVRDIAGEVAGIVVDELRAAVRDVARDLHDRTRTSVVKAASRTAEGVWDAAAQAARGVVASDQ
ncbi:hypothetical protein EF912_14485 [Streptomyces sp. WAC07061]|uniref:hypothetical protein n=1 Tax=Streptomyces sp. WAC07061 TaxID=2487410 RepID=UPI000F78EA73|nr:hypothetical protein [Streptomyces sp. WAC07061]RSS56258.1 hypothetical protein EF912_14485 [Streptomyces sp. WAC07061]